MRGPQSSFWIRLPAYWGIVGFVLLIAQALVRFYPILAAALTPAPSAGDLAKIFLSMILFAIGKGYFILQKQFAPRFALRVRELATPPTRLVHGVLAPLYCLSLVGAERSRLARGYLLLGAIVLMIVGAKQLPDTMYAAVLAGVAVALAWGAAAVVIKSVRSLGAMPRVAAPRAGT